MLSSGTGGAGRLSRKKKTSEKLKRSFWHRWSADYHNSYNRRIYKQRCLLWAALRTLHTLTVPVSAATCSSAGLSAVRCCGSDSDRCWLRTAEPPERHRGGEQAGEGELTKCVDQIVIGGGSGEAESCSQRQTERYGAPDLTWSKRNWNCGHSIAITCARNTNSWPRSRYNVRTKY